MAAERGYSSFGAFAGSGFATNGGRDTLKVAGTFDEQDTNANMFDEASFERAFDAARAEIFAENDMIQSASKRPETLDSGGVDIYPGRELRGAS